MALSGCEWVVLLVNTRCVLRNLDIFVGCSEILISYPEHSHRFGAMLLLFFLGWIFSFHGDNIVQVASAFPVKIARSETREAASHYTGKREIARNHLKQCHLANKATSSLDDVALNDCTQPFKATSSSDEVALLVWRLLKTIEP